MDPVRFLETDAVRFLGTGPSTTRQLLFLKLVLSFRNCFATLQFRAGGGGRLLQFGSWFTASCVPEPKAQVQNSTLHKLGNSGKGTNVSSSESTSTSAR